MAADFRIWEIAPGAMGALTTTIPRFRVVWIALHFVNVERRLERSDFESVSKRPCRGLTYNKKLVTRPRYFRTMRRFAASIRRRFPSSMLHMYAHSKEKLARWAPLFRECESGSEFDRRVQPVAH
jgi:hypothetical protein